MEKKREQQTMELSVSDIEAVLTPEPLYGRQSASVLGRDEQGRQIIDDPFARTIIDGRYEVVRCIGTGAMGSVFLVNHLRLGKLFALKMVNPALAGLPEFAARFEREADACSRLTHPNCISVTDFGQTSDGSLYLVMEYADGVLLNQLLEKGTVSLSEAVEYIRQVLLGLKHAHNEGLVHRDIKLENIVKCNRDDGQVILKILDFGMAKHPLQDPRNPNITQDGLVMGTPQYMAPEQIRGDHVDARADLYAVGVTLFRLITGQLIFDGETHMDVFAAKLKNKAPTLFEVTGQSYPEALESFIAKALERDPNNRFSNADEMLDALERIASQLLRTDSVKPPLPVPEKSRFAAAATGILRRVDDLFLEIWNDTSDWFACSEQSGTPCWKHRIKGLVTTRAGRIFLIRLAAVLTIAIILMTGLSDSGNRPEAKSAGVRAPSPIPEKESFPVQEKSPLPEVSPSKSDEVAAVLPLIEAASLKTEQKTEPKEESLSDADPIMIEAALFIEQNKCRRAEKTLMKSAELESARVLYLLGQSNACLGQNAKALSYYKKAIAKDDRYRTDSRILEDAKKMVSSSSIRLDALEFMAEDLGKAALPSLIQMAGRHSSREVRRKAAFLVEKQGAVDLVDIEAALDLDLNQAKSCDEKRKIVEKLAALRTKAATQVLIRARDAEVKESFFKTRYKHLCVRKDIIQALTDMKKKNS